MSKPNVALIGLAVMGSNLARNIERNGFPIAVYNRTGEVTKEFISSFGSGKNFIAAFTLEELVASLERPRQIILMVKAGAPVDAILEDLLNLLEPGDIVIDGGNSYFTDTERRQRRALDKGVRFLGVGISGGEEGALNGPSIMPGGEKEAWEVVAPVFEKISAKAPHPCTGYVGPGGAGHFVKMVHNGIEYGDMQLIAEIYQLLRDGLKLSPESLSRLFEEWNSGVLNSFLIEITAKIFKERDQLSDAYLVDKIADAAGQKGTGMWTAQVALDLGIAAPTLASAVDARFLSALTAQRQEASKLFGSQIDIKDSCAIATSTLHDALYSAKVITYAQGMAVLSAASAKWGWNLNLSSIAKMWEGGCIIRAAFLGEIAQAYSRNPQLSNLILDASLSASLKGAIAGLRSSVALAAAIGSPLLALGSALSYFDSLRCGRLPQSLTQAQRDFFGAHTYQRNDRAGVFHTEWGKH